MMILEKYARQSPLKTFHSSTTSSYITSSNIHMHTHTHMCNQHFTPVHTEYEQPTDCAGQSTADYNAASDNV